MTDDELGPLYDLLIDEPPMIRRAIGELVYDHLIAQNVKSSLAGSRGIVPLVHERAFALWCILHMLSFFFGTWTDSQLFFCKLAIENG